MVLVFIIIAPINYCKYDVKLAYKVSNNYMSCTEMNNCPPVYSIPEYMTYIELFNNMQLMIDILKFLHDDIILDHVFYADALGGFL